MKESSGIPILQGRAAPNSLQLLARLSQFKAGLAALSRLRVHYATPVWRLCAPGVSTSTSLGWLAVLTLPFAAPSAAAARSRRRDGGNAGRERQRWASHRFLRHFAALRYPDAHFL